MGCVPVGRLNARSSPDWGTTLLTSWLAESFDSCSFTAPSVLGTIPGLTFRHSAPSSGPLSLPFIGSISGPLSRPLSGPFSGPVSGPLSGQLGGPFSGQISGPLSGPISGPISGTLSGPLRGTLSGRGCTRFHS